MTRGCALSLLALPVAIGVKPRFATMPNNVVR